MNREIRTYKYNSSDYKQALKLRERILRQPLGLQFTEAELKKDEHDIHFGLFKNDIIFASLTLAKTENGRMKMRQVAVDNLEQGKGLGKELSLAAEKFAFESGYYTMYCNARKVAAPFYLKLGYKIIGDEFTEVNISHYLMEKILR